MDKEGLSSPSCSFKVLSWNINGIRTFKNLKEMLDDLHADVVCFQETKITRDMIDESIAVVDGYNAYFSFSRTRSGYSGVATYCRERATPISAEEGLSGALNSPAHQDTVGCFDNVKEEFTPQELKRLDSEGRTVITQHQIKKTDGSDALLTILNVYCPRADPEKPERLQFKLRFLKLLELRARAISLSGSLVMIVGDVNVSHRTVDRCEIVDPTEFEGDPARQWLNSFLVDLQRFKEDVSKGKVFNDFKMIDSFRYFYPDKENAFTCWNTMINARSTNYGSRIDYIFVDRELIKSMIDSLVLSEVQGSDHCPISGTFDVEPQKATKCPSICTKNFPEFFGVQQKLSAFFLKNSKTASNNPNNSPKSTCDMHHQLSKRKISKIGSNNYGCEETSKKPKVQSNFSQKQISSFFQKNSCLANNSFVSADQKTLSSFSEVCSLEDEYSHDLNSETQRLVRCESAASAWRSILTGPQPAPLCKGHKEPCVERTVKKKGPNFNKKFFACARGEGSKNDLKARCDHFEWAAKK